MKLHLIIIFVSCNCFCYCQKINSIEINFDNSQYSKTAIDTVREIIRQQQKLNLKDTLNAANMGNRSIDRKHVGNHYKPEELNFISIPVFRISRSAFFDYNCDQNFEKYITFNERLKYQHTLVFHDKVFLGSIRIPNNEYEMDLIYSGTNFLEGFGKNYYANSLFFYEYFTSSDVEFIRQKPNNFLFELFGLPGFLFDIENGKIYAQYGSSYDGGYGDITIRRPLNEFIITNNLVDHFKEVALGMYVEEWDNPNCPSSKKCNEADIPKGVEVAVIKSSR